MIELEDGIFIDIGKAAVIEVMTDKNKIKEGTYQSAIFTDKLKLLCLNDKCVIIQFNGTNTLSIFNGKNAAIIAAYLDQYKR